MACRYCAFDMGHAPNCPAYDPKETKTASPESDRSPVRYSGREFEYDLFGQADTRNPEYLEALRRVRKPDGYVTYKDAMDLAKKFQPWDPDNPNKDFFRELLIAVQDRLGIDTGKTSNFVKVYTALKTPLDEQHGVDAFLAVGREGRESVVTLDATLNREKQASGHKADLIIGDDFPLVEDDEKGYLAAIDALAGRIASRIEKREPPQPRDLAA